MVLLNAIAFAAVGIVLFAVSFWLLTGKFWRQALEERNISVAIILAAVALALGWIIAAAVH
jgi:uncharacterized membrane protein YjfL (UPF0719 family)